ncbi:CDP-6-deoxy-D-xylo-4-hexulose-3-dehydrase [Paenibacillus polymyxa]|uniref:lipopolysaccharide biosynthesis protein RfbH n=1 Tax=Paenibacillus polymyxa TaxID=1406 RepID=UPI00278D22AF|nr:lipopolysaccharide biosynthesis protein RfbH [Paenibacillus polymyxa]MDQ0048945.1 CDP-6-deoxy-D-xylo-4-hexulose-3-dehydrase [Paenibacillus polymyxa]
MKNSDQIKLEILQLTKEYYQMKKTEDSMQESQTRRIDYAGRVYDEKEMVNLMDSSLEFWLTSGRYTKQFEKQFARFLGVKHCYTCNSGSSANLLAFMSLTSPLLKDRRILPGDEVITVAAGFPTTVAPIIQYGAVPVFVDITLPEYNIDCSQLDEALTDKTKAVMIAHTLGNPFDLGVLKKWCEEHQLWLIEDNCDALGSKYYVDGKWKLTGTIGDIGTSSFYPPHHMTMGEGGAVYTNNHLLSKIILSLRDWGRDCYCPSGVDNTCCKRFNGQHGQLPFGYDHKYVYSHFGYNLKITDMQAAIGCAQLEKLDSFISARINNWDYLRKQLQPLDNVLVLPEPNEKSQPSWFGFLIGVKGDAGFTRDNIVEHLEKHHVQTRMLFAGNLIMHPCFDTMREDQRGFRQIGDLANTNFAMNQSFWIGVYPGMTEDKLDYMIEVIKQFVQTASMEHS